MTSFLDLDSDSAVGIGRRTGAGAGSATVRVAGTGSFTAQVQGMVQPKLQNEPKLDSFTAPCASPRSAMKTGANPGFISGVLYDSGLPTVNILELKMDTVLESFRDSVFGTGQGH